MASQVDAGPATNNGEYFFGQTCGVEFHASVGSNSLGPASAPNVDFQVGTSLNASTAINKTTAGVLFVSPA